MARFYLLCIIKTEKFATPSWQGLNLSTISNNGLSLVLTEVPQDIYNPRFMLLHSSLSEKLLDEFPLLPVRFGTILESRDKGYELLAKEESRFMDLFDKLTGKVEMGLKAIWQAAAPLEQAGVQKPTSGTEYLLARARQQKSKEAARERAEALGKQINQEFQWTEEVKTSYLVTPKLFYKGAFLIGREEQALFWEVVKKLKIDGCKFLASGPWSAYNFCN